MYEMLSKSFLRNLKFFGKIKDEVPCPKIHEIKERWESPLSKLYIKMDSMGSSSYYTLASMMQLNTSKHILEVGSGRCAFLPQAMLLKNSESTYLATDLSQKMIEYGHQYLQTVLQSYRSTLSYEQWLQQNKITIRAANGEESMGCDYKFDRIIANLVLMLTQDPKKMLLSLYNQAEQGCLLGVTIWGNPSLNDVYFRLQKIIDDSLTAGVEIPKTRPNHHLYNKADIIANEVGWKTVLKWQQNNVFRTLNSSELNDYLKGVAQMSTSTMNKEQQQYISTELIKQIKELYDKNIPARFPTQMFIFKK